MDSFGISRATLRAQVLNRLASFTAKTCCEGMTEGYEKITVSLNHGGKLFTEPTPSLNEDLSKNGIVTNGNGKIHGIAIPTKELDVLLALASSVPYLREVTKAKNLLNQLGLYLMDSYRQYFTPSPLIRDMLPSPWEVLTNKLVLAIIDISQRFDKLADEANKYIMDYITAINKKISTTPYNLATILPLSFSLQGFLLAVGEQAQNYESSEVQYQLISSIATVFRGDFCVHLEEALSILRTSNDPTSKVWNYYRLRYRASGKSFGSASLRYSFVEAVRNVSGLYVVPFCLYVTPTLEASSKTKPGSFLDDLMEGARMNAQLDSNLQKSLSLCRDIALAEIANVDDGADYIDLMSARQRRLSFAVKASALEILCIAVFSGLHKLSDLMQTIDTSLANDDQVMDEQLISTIFKIMALMCRSDSDIGASLTRIFPRLIVRYNATKETIQIGAVCVAYALKSLSEDAVISTLYTLSNIIVPVGDVRKLANTASRVEITEVSSKNLERVTSMGSSISLLSASEDERNIIYENIIHALARVVENYNDAKINALAISVLMQKIGRFNDFIDRSVVIALSGLALSGTDRDLRTILKLYSRLCVEAVVHGDTGMTDAILDARIRISKKLRLGDMFYDVYLKDLLDAIVSKGDVQELEHHRPHHEITVTAKEISLLIKPLAALLPAVDQTPYKTENLEILVAFRNAWFNIVVHGYLRGSDWAKMYRQEFEIIAWNSPTLISESSSNRFESDMEINTVLRRGSSHHNMNDLRQQILSAFSSTALEVRTIPYPKLVFLAAALFLESVRASVGDCSKVLLYFVDPGLKSGDTHKFMLGIADEVMNIYLNKFQSKQGVAASESVSKQLRQILIYCCHRIQSVSAVAFTCTQRLIDVIPSALCNRESLFTLLELLTLLWNSCLDEDVDQYSPKSVFVSAKANISLELSDSYIHRKETLKYLDRKARAWVQRSIDLIPMDMKGLLQAYLAEIDDFKAFGHVALGRSFAVEMGGRIPASDNRLASIGRQADTGTDTASDFLAQYTWRQVYRKVESNAGTEDDDHDFPTVLTMLSNLKKKVLAKKFISIAELRESLLRATAYSLKNVKISSPLLHYLAFIPLTMFTKQSVKLGVSIWLWILTEAPELQSRILAEIVLGFEWSIRNHGGIYSRAHDIIPVLDGRMEYAPSSKDEIVRAARLAVNSFAPHMYIIDMLSSHFQSSRFESPHLLEIFERALRVALLNMKDASHHPLVRENRFNVILFSLQLLEGHNNLSSQRSTYFKNLTLTAALTWFAKPATYPFGGNRLHLKSEFRLLLKVYHLVKNITVKGPEKNLLLDVKRELLMQFLENEVYAMSIWLEPLQFVPYRQLKSVIPKNSSVATPEMVVVAWQEDPALAVYYAKRFKQHNIEEQLMQLIANDTGLVVDIGDALSYLLESRKAESLVLGWKYLSYWTRSAPIDAINLFMPGYNYDPLVLQYAMRSLESHGVDVTFFYVPQIVQMMRHDKSGYIEQFILDTGKLDQLFAHQIIWNMQANAYRDEDEKVPDPIKPTLDRVMDTLIASFKGQDRDFYDREFDFFRDVTSISGKLKPYIKKSKAEKKIKIDEEMGKIRVDVGVYLPSNPDGVVIGIDRKSGRPLQSHAKAPFMATFKIRKEVKIINTIRIEGEDDSEKTAVETVEKMLSAIFKVGDDCRQDMLALQLIALFRSIFSASGLDLYLFPYRVVATYPGCGIIDVLPNSISRDMLGREAVNGLYEYFISKHGSEDSIKFQQARNGFVQSMAAYSVISYLLQFKDRHNGNIMYDDQGHVLHIDFGFCFDIVPGGVRFEAAPFKLTHEMVQVMGGSPDTQAYHWFEELSIKAFLASRPYAESIIKCVMPMLESGLPCFKGETTIRRLRERFVLEKSDKDAADYMRGLIKKSAESLYTKGYDEFQRMTNGIPY
ncbi:hypothetical protein V1512DRAFT_171225 [Lipomyces arxii]|uniref:uncharacterized protein n=1 Tax=Lipomyces arxii TaxID=56418 RepID=UPI0034CD6D71